MLLSFGCRKQESNIEEMFEEIIREYDKVDFNQYLNLEMYIRERRIWRDAIYLSSVSYGDDVLSEDLSALLWWYVIIINYNGILSIRDDNSTNKNYISNDSIKLITNDFLKLNLNYLKVDYNNTIYLAPSCLSNERTFMIKVNNSILLNEKHLRLKGDGSFTHYKGQWYVSDFYIDKYNLKNKFQKNMDD